MGFKFFSNVTHSVILLLALHKAIPTLGTCFQNHTERCHNRLNRGKFIPGGYFSLEILFILQPFTESVFHLQSNTDTLAEITHSLSASPHGKEKTELLPLLQQLPTQGAISAPVQIALSWIQDDNTSKRSAGFCTQTSGGIRIALCLVRIAAGWLSKHVHTLQYGCSQIYFSVQFLNTSSLA